MEDLVASQNQLMGVMEHLLTNFKKDGADRKTTTYVKKRLSTLESYWQEFQLNHAKLNEFGQQDHEYFTNDYFNETFELYNNARTFILKYLPEPREKIISKPTTPQINPSSLLQPSYSNQQSHLIDPQREENTGIMSKGTSSRLEDMLRRQKSNFKAFARTLDSIHLEVLTEKWEFDDALKSIQSRWSGIDTLHWQIDSEGYEDDIEYEEAFSSYEQRYNEIKKQINTKMWSECHREKATPQIDVPIFSGNYHSWVSFKDLFAEIIHNNRTLPSAQKMQYLKSKLRGEPEKLIQHLHVTSDNYQVAWDILNQRYNNKKLIFNSHMNILMNIPVMQVQSSISIKRIHDSTNECLNAIKNLGVDVKTWDPLIVYLISQKLDTYTHNDYIESLKHPRELPSLRDFLEFLEAKFTALESSKRKSENKMQHQQQPHQHQHNRQIPSTSNIKKYHTYNYKPSNQLNQFAKSYNSNVKVYRPQSQKCAVCNKDHAIFHCDTFLEFQPHIKQETINKLSLCKNCLYDHKGKVCFSMKRCRLCKGEHNTLLHEVFGVKSNVASSSKSNEIISSKNSMTALQDGTQEVLLATAQIKVQAEDGSNHILRALIDQGSQASIISENAAQLLGLRRQRCKGIILGVGSTENHCKGTMNITIKSIHDQFSINVNVFIMNKAVNNLPNKSFNKPTWPYIQNLPLADPEFYHSRSVDLLLGVDVYAAIMMDGVIKINESTPIAQQTKFGWILCGNVKSYQCNVVTLSVDEIQKFWSIEDINDSTDLSQEDYECLRLYESTTTRQSDGRYVVRLPLHPDIESKLGHSKTRAVAQFYQIEKKFCKEEKLAIDYKLFMTEYYNLGHMRLAVSNQIPSYYMPHHGVRRAESTTTSLRVVFNASQPTSNGLSLNDLMFRGPNMQQDLMLLIVKWRQYKYAITADIEKMFRQIYIHEQDQKYQKIIWRESQHQPLQEYQLMTVTYGTKAAPFLAMQTLKQLANDEGHRFPEAAKAVKEQFYMDDLLSGGYKIETTKQLQSDLITLLKLGGFNLRKWSSNEPEILTNIKCNQNHQENFDFKHQESTKTLGLTWNSREDNFTFQCKMSNPPSKKLTKRILLGEISKVFDPLGWLSPVVVKLKLLFQNVWLIDLRWDDVIPEKIHTEWLKLRSDIENINTIKVPRWLQCEQEDTIQLHGFCDASTKAYACVIYARIWKRDKATASVTLLAAKTKLVPVTKKAKDTAKNEHITLPRLELCGAQLLAKLMSKVMEGLTNHKIDIYGWCDSTAVLGWLHGEPSRWKPFVANRVKMITEKINPNYWHYIKSHENPADCASRGMTISQLNEHQLWWKGPSWLESFDKNNFNQDIKHVTNLELKKNQTNVVQINQTTENNIISSLISKYSNFTQITRAIAWLLRLFSRDQPKPAYLTNKDLELAEIKIIKYIQQCEFSEDIQNLRNHGTVIPKSKLSCLNPFLDTDGVLRVGGRLRSSHLEFEMKHPRIMPYQHVVTSLLIDQAHKQTFHGGARLTHSKLRQKYWILSGNRAVKFHIIKCVLCKRHKPMKHHQIMGDLPESRTTPTRPFYHTGVDFTGHVEVKASKGRGIKTSKGYVAVFVCMVTKAVHLELVSDLTSSSFLAALRRMAARRGTPRHVYSDNGTNFTKAAKILYSELKSIITNEFLSEVSEMQITWHFNAPSWPSAGGLWEAAVKSLKHHLRRVLGEQKLTFEEFQTLLSQLEACLNSRPLCALTEDPDDIDFLTPSHFLASGPNLTIIETETDERTRWQLTQKLTNDIWRRWRTEYLTQLTSRSKWQRSQPNIELNDIVIIHDANLPPGKWSLGRVVEIHPGADGHVRVVSVKTKNGVLKRPIIKLSVLPVNNQDKQSKHDDQKTLPPEENHLTSSVQDQPKIVSENNQSPAPVEIKQTKRKITRNGMQVNFISLIIMLMLLLVSTVQGAYNISNIENSKGLYFDKISNMRLVRDEWKMIIYYNMDPYWQGSKLLNKYIGHLENICSKLQKRQQCDVILLQLRHGSTELQYNDQLLLGQRSATGIRVRRGLINAVGSVAHALFGVLDDDFAIQYQKDIDLIRENQQHLVKLYKNQTSVIEAQFNFLKRLETSIDQQYKLFNQHIMRLEKDNLVIREEVERLRATNEFTLSSIIANNILADLKKLQNILLDTITDIYHGKFDIHIISPDQLKDELSLISGHLSKEVSLPIDDIHNGISKLYHLLRVKAKVTDQYLLFEVKIPLITREGYDIYKIIPLPQLVQENQMTSIIPISEYIAMNIQKDSYVPMSQTDVHNCLHVDMDTSFCELQGPVYHMQEDKNLCFKNISSDKCQVTTNYCKNTWTALNKINTYLFYCCEKCTLRLMCGGQVSTERLSKAGVLSIGNDCVIKGDSFMIHSHNRQSNDLKTQPDFINIDIPPINDIINLTVPIDLEFDHKLEEDRRDRQKSLQEIDHRIQEMKNSDVDLKQMSYHDVHHYIVIYVLVGICGAAAAVFLWRRVRAHHHRRALAEPPLAAVELQPQRRPAPAPRLSLSLHDIASASVSASASDRVCEQPKASVQCQCENPIGSQQSARVIDKATSPVFKSLNFNDVRLSNISK